MGHMDPSPIAVIEARGAPGDIKMAEKTKPERARNQRPNVGAGLEKSQRGRDGINLGDIRVTNGAQRGGGVSRQDTSLWSHQLTARVIARNSMRNIVARKRKVNAGHRAEIMVNASGFCGWNSRREKSPGQ